MSRWSRGLRTESPDPLPRLEKAPCHPLRLSGSCTSRLGVDLCRLVGCASGDAADCLHGRVRVRQRTLLACASVPDVRSGVRGRGPRCDGSGRCRHLPGSGDQFSTRKAVAGRRRLSAAPAAKVVVKAELDVRAAHLELRGMTIEQVNFLRSADDVTLRNVINHGMWMQGPSNISIIGGEISCGFCAYHSHLQNGGADAAPPRNILFDGVNFHDWHSVSGEHTECLQILGGDNITIRNSTFRSCGTGNGGLGATGDLFIGWLGGNGPVTKNILLENNFFYPSGNHFAIQMATSPASTFATTRSPARSSSSIAKAPARAWT